MGRKDSVSKKFLERDDIFADVVNFALFDGKEVIMPDDLTAADPTEIAVLGAAKNAKSVQKWRDILKYCTIKRSKDATYVIIGTEIQSEIHYAMVVKNMMYDVIDYENQVEQCVAKHREEKDYSDTAEFLSGFTKDDKLRPVITITIYLGDKPWDGPRSLREMMTTSDERILQYIPDYKLNLIAPSEIEDFSVMKTELGFVLNFIQNQNNPEWLDKQQENKELWITKQAVSVINTYTGAGIKVPTGKGGVHMCKAVEALQARAAKEAVADYKQKVIKEAEADSKKTAERLYYSNLDEGKPKDVRIQSIATMIAQPVEIVKMWLADLLVEPTKM